MPKGFLDDQKIDVPCPECRRKVAARIGQLKRSPQLTCGSGHVFDVDAKELVREITKVEKALADFGKGLKF